MTPEIKPNKRKFHIWVLLSNTNRRRPIMAQEIDQEKRKLRAWKRRHRKLRAALIDIAVGFHGNNSLDRDGMIARAERALRKDVEHERVDLDAGR